MAYYRNLSGKPAKKALAAFREAVEVLMSDLGAEPLGGPDWALETIAGRLRVSLDDSLSVITWFREEDRAREILGGIVRPSGLWPFHFDRTEDPADCVRAVREAFRHHLQLG